MQKRSGTELERESAAGQTDDIENMTSPSTLGVTKATEMFKLDVYFLNYFDRRACRACSGSKDVKDVVHEGLRTRLQGVMGKLEK